MLPRARENGMANNRVNADAQKRRRFALPLSVAGYAER